MQFFERKYTLRTRWAMAAVAAAVTLLPVACASIGRPEGGKRDEMPPVFVRSNPAPGAVSVTPKRVDIWFDENVELDDAFNKVVVSPTQKQTPVVRSLGRHVWVNFNDTLLQNTTYTIDFADAIKDLNEGNILDGFAVDFSTGPDIDTLRLSGIVLAARNLEPAQGITVGIYASPADTALTTRPFERIARTNQYGQFTVRNLKPGSYEVFAINDLNRDHRWDRTEDVAFLGKAVIPAVEDITVGDTVRLDDGRDSISTRPGVHYLPDDLLLTWFNENYRQQYLKSYQRPDRRRILIKLGAPTDTLPQLTVAGGPLDGRNVQDMSLLEANETNDSLVYWLRDPQLLATDSLRLAVRHQGVDTLNQVVWQTDTLRFFWSDPKVKKKKDKDGEADTVIVTPLDLSVRTLANHNLYEPLRLQASTPLERVDSAGFHLEMLVDTLWTPAKLKAPVVDPEHLLAGILVDFDRKEGQKYRLTVDSAAVSDIYGLVNKPIRHEFQMRQPEDYSSLAFVLSNTPDSVNCVVELLDTSDKVVRTETARNGKVNFRYLEPGTYYARLFLDANGNGKWDTGNVALLLQPEEVYYYPKKMELKANWDVSQSWDIYEQPLDRQKPNAIKVNKPKLKKGESYQDEDGDVEYDEWGDPIDPNDPTRNSRMDRGNNRRGGNRGGNRGGFGGFQQIGTGANAGTRRR